MIKIVLNLPLPVFGVVSISGTVQSGVKVNLRNNRTSELINTNTNSSGVYVLDAANLASGYEDTDSLTSFVLSGLYEGESTVNVSDSEHEANLALTAITTTATITYCTVDDVWNELDGKTSSDISASRIVTAIQSAEGLIDEKTETKWNENTATDEEHDLNQYTFWQSPESLMEVGHTGVIRGDFNFPNTGRNRFRLDHTPVISITSLSKNSAGQTSTDSWTALTEQTGSGGDFTVNKITGEVDFIKNTPRQGKRAVKSTYTYGNATTPVIVRKLCAKLAAMDILSTKVMSSQFGGTGSIRLDTIEIKPIVSAKNLQELKMEINDLWDAVGQLSVVTTG